MRKQFNARKGFARLAAISLAAGLCVLTGCGGTTSAPGGEDVRETDAEKTQLIIAAGENGVGSQWLKNSAARFEEAYKDVSFEKGKKGVQCTILSAPNYMGSNLVDTVQSESADVWFLEAVTYTDYVKKGNMADITDIVTEELTEFGENKTIAEKMSGGYSEFLNNGTEEKPKYYAIPYFDGFYGLTYDKDLFAEKNLYFKSSGTEAGDGADNLGFVTSDSDKKSAGVDGKLGTRDDGLPATYAQFLSLIEEMKKQGITPFAVNGGTNYQMRTMATFWARTEGPEQYALNQNLKGTATDLVKLDSNGKIVWNGDKPAIETLEITPDNAYELQRQVGKYQALKLWDRIIADKKNYPDRYLSHINAQIEFMKGKSDKFKDYGMLIDGIWWVNEASSSFNALSGTLGEGFKKENRNFGFMPLPVAEAEDIGKQNVLMAATDGLCFIRSTTKVLDCAKAFLKFTSSDAELSEFVGDLSFTRSLNHELTEEAAKRVTSFGRDVNEIKQESYVAYNVSTEPLYINNMAKFSVYDWPFLANIAGSQFYNPWQFWTNYSGQYTAEQYFEAMYPTQKQAWGNLQR